MFLSILHRSEKIKSNLSNYIHVLFFYSSTESIKMIRDMPGFLRNKSQVLGKQISRLTTITYNI